LLGPARLGPFDFGKTINVGAHADAVKMTVAGQTITITGASLTITGSSGNAVVNGISLVHHKHPDPQGVFTGEPV
jgi:hypothetical protein